ncbi:Endoplasmic reticulum mannosyl-oligosaccharide 1,2-alpha-mannosidase [Paramyrothecium foliicola]|nr:Endoplasmic reticulum mannosyl-oligosaccharide 1,2-alpha-mannosidase [Paramyrothecium foliicola]
MAPVERVPDSVWRGESNYFWKTVSVNYPATTFQALPTSDPQSLPQVQATFSKETDSSRQLRLEHQKAVKDTLIRCWNSYKKHAWMADEVGSLSGNRHYPLGGWAATLVDTLDTLWIMDLRDEFNEAVSAIDGIDFTQTDMGEINIFETTIRYLGGFLAAFELSNDTRLINKAVELGEMIYKAFDTPNHLPITRWDLHAAAKGDKQTASSGVLIAEIGSLCLELTRLSEHTGDLKWFDAVQLITELFAAQQDATELPGLWPLMVDAQEPNFSRGSTFTLVAMADSLYEYLPKMAAMLGSQLPIYHVMYEKAVDTASKNNLFRPMTPTNENILISGQVRTKKEAGKVAVEVYHEGQHLVCFLGGNLALGSNLFNRPQDVSLGEKLMDGCIYTYKAFPNNIMPANFHMAPCPSKNDCMWDEDAWKREVPREADKIIKDKGLPKGFTCVADGRYILRPEAIESVLMLYRITGRQDLVDSAWDMFTAIEKVTKTNLANAAISQMSEPWGRSLRRDTRWNHSGWARHLSISTSPFLIRMISLDDYVFNTKAHPLKRKK